MARGKQTCKNTGVHLMGAYKIVRVNKKKKQTTTITGVRCKWCKRAEGRINKEVVNNG